VAREKMLKMKGGEERIWGNYGVRTRTRGLYLDSKNDEVEETSKRGDTDGKYICLGPPDEKGLEGGLGSNRE